MKICFNVVFYILSLLLIIFIGDGISNSGTAPDSRVFQCENLIENELTSERSVSLNNTNFCFRSLFCMENRINLSQKNKKLLKTFAIDSKKLLQNNSTEIEELSILKVNKLYKKILKHGVTVRFGDNFPLNSKILKTLGYRSYEIVYLVSEIRINEILMKNFITSLGSLLAKEISNKCNLEIVSVRKVLINNKINFILESYAYSVKGKILQHDSIFSKIFIEEN